MRLPMLVLLTSACGRSGFDSIDAAVDASATCVPAFPAAFTATYVGIAADETLGRIHVTANGDVIGTTTVLVTGYPTTGGAQPTFAGGVDGDALFVRMSGDLTTLQRATYFGGPTREHGAQFAFGPDDSALLGVWSQGMFPVTAGAAAMAYDNSADDFAAARISSDLTTTIGATYWNASDAADEQLGGICANPVNGDIYLVGEHLLGQSPVFTAPGFDRVKNGGTDAVAIRFTPTLTSVLDNTLKGLGDPILAGMAGAAGQEAFGGCVVSPEGQFIYLTGRAEGPLLGTQATPGSAFPTPVDIGDPFVCKYTADLTSEVACTHLGVTGGATLARDWEPAAFFVHPNGDFYIVESVPATTTWMPSTPGVLQFSSAGGKEVAITRLSSDLSKVIASTYLGTTGDDEARDAVVLPDGSIAIVGKTSGSVSTTSDAIQPNAPGGGADGAIVIVSADLSRIMSSTYFGDASAVDVVNGVAFDPASGSLYVAGATGGGLAVTAGTAQPTYGGGATDGYLARITVCP